MLVTAQPAAAVSFVKNLLNPVIATTVVGIALGVLATFGLAQLSSNEQIPSPSLSSNDALLGGVEYGAR